MAVLFPDAIPRPTCSTPAVREKAMADFWPEVLKWLHPLDPGEGEERMRKQLEQALEWDRNGYDVAKTLDHHGWCPDAELVELLDGWSWYVDVAEDAATKAWVKDCCIAPKHCIGDVVTGKWGMEMITGKVVEVYHDTARYVIRRECDKPTEGAILKFEDVKEPEVASV